MLNVFICEKYYVEKNNLHPLMAFNFFLFEWGVRENVRGQFCKVSSLIFHKSSVVVLRSQDLGEIA